METEVALSTGMCKRCKARPFDRKEFENPATGETKIDFFCSECRAEVVAMMIKNATV